MVLGMGMPVEFYYLLGDAVYLCRQLRWLHGTRREEEEAGRACVCWSSSP